MTSEEDSIMKKIAVFTFAPLLALAVAATSSLAFAQTSGTGATGGVTSPNRPLRVEERAPSRGERHETAPSPAG